MKRFVFLFISLVLILVNIVIGYIWFVDWSILNNFIGFFIWFLSIILSFIIFKKSKQFDFKINKILGELLLLTGIIVMLLFIGAIIIYFIVNSMP